MAVVHVALERRFLGSFLAEGKDPLQEARRAAAERGSLPEGRGGEARCLVRDGHSLYCVELTEAGWQVAALHAGEVVIPMGHFPTEGLAHDWLLTHLGFVAVPKAEAVN